MASRALQDRKGPESRPIGPTLTTWLKLCEFPDEPLDGGRGRKRVEARARSCYVSAVPPARNETLLASPRFHRVGRHYCARLVTLPRARLVENPNQVGS